MRREITGRRKERVRNRRDPRYLSIQKRYMCSLGKFLRRGRISRIQIKELSEKTHVWHSTFYDHFIHMDDAIEQYWHDLEPSLKELASELGGRNLSLTKIFTKILIFIYHNREYYDVVLTCGNYVALSVIIEIFLPLLSKGWSKYNQSKSELAIAIFAGEFSGEIYYWGRKEHFNFDRILEHAKTLAKLSENATQRLA